jgi:hypothetical protein
MRSAFACGYGETAFAAWLAEPKLARVSASEGWTTDMFIEAVYNGSRKSR